LRDRNNPWQPDEMQKQEGKGSLPISLERELLPKVPLR
jgi:hypothetical protein